MIIAGIPVTYNLAGLIGIAIATTAMLSWRHHVALDAFGPVTDNAGGIAEMAEPAPEKRASPPTPPDAVGNTTKAVTKGYAIGLGRPRLWCFRRPYTEDLKYFGQCDDGLVPSSGGGFDLSNPYVMVGLLSALLPFLFGGWSMTAVGRGCEWWSR